MPTWRLLLHAVGHAVEPLGASLPAGSWPWAASPACLELALGRHLHRGCRCCTAEQHQGSHGVPVPAHSCGEAHGCDAKPDGVLVVVCFSGFVHI